MKTAHINPQLSIFNKYYNRYYQLFAWRCKKALKDEVAGSGMVQDAFVRLWLLRDQLLEEEIYTFLKAHLKKEIFAFYDQARNRFDARLFRFDELENPDFLLQVRDEEIDEFPEEDWNENDADRQHWRQLQLLIPNLTESQQRLIQLCIRYNFNYDRIAYCLGGIADYVVARQVEELLKKLKCILHEDNKLLEARRTGSITIDGNLSELQQKVMQMRYDLQYSFEEIAGALAIDEGQVKLAFARALRTCG